MATFCAISQATCYERMGDVDGGVSRDKKGGLAYVNPVERFTPARNAETVDVLVVYAILEEGFGLLRTASNA